MLYLHGFVDYFFHTHVADAFAVHGYDFYALDLRKYGRSLLAGQTPYYSTDIAEYDEEIDAAIDIIRAEGHDEVVAYGHSTGGLIFPLWANRRRGKGLIQAMVLNSPFFDLNASDFERGFLTKLVDKVGRFAPRIIVSKLPSPYARALHTNNGGEWDFDPEWEEAGRVPGAGRVAAHHPPRTRADRPRHRPGRTDPGGGVHRVRRRPARGRPNLPDTDCVLNVEHMVTGAPADRPARHGGADRVRAARPDPVAAGGARQKFLDEMFDWLGATLPVD